MKTRSLIAKFSALFCLVLILSVSGCSLIGNAVGDGAAKGVATGLDDPETKKKIAHFADSLLNALNESLKPKVRGLEDTLLNHKVILWADSLIETISGNKLQANARALQSILVGKTTSDIIQIRNSLKTLIDDLLSDKTNQKLGQIRDNLLGQKTDDDIGKLRDEILGPKTALEISNLRDQLLGAKTDTAISHIVDNAAKKFVARVNPAIQGDVSFVSKNATLLLVTLAIIALVIIGFVWWNKTKYARMVTLLTKHINAIPDQGVYDQVTKKIKDEAITAGLEPGLQKILLANGLTGGTNWKK